MSHHHHHEHGSERALAVSVVLNLLMSIAEIIGGIVSGSVALLGDAFHNLSDTLSLFIAAIAIRIGRKPSDELHSYGHHRAEIIAAFFNSGAMMAVALFVAWESLSSFFTPHSVKSGVMFIVALIGLVVNAGSVAMLFKHSSGSMNIRGAFLHLLADTLSSVAVVIGAIIMRYTGITWIDSLIGVLIAVYIFKESLILFKDSLRVLMQSTPHNISREAVESVVADIPEIDNIHHIHVWQLGEHSVMTEAHISFAEDLPLSAAGTIRNKVAEQLKHSLGISHVTLQMEYQSDCTDISHSL